MRRSTFVALVLMLGTTLAFALESYAELLAGWQPPTASIPAGRNGLH